MSPPGPGAVVSTTLATSSGGPARSPRATMSSRFWATVMLSGAGAPVSASCTRSASTCGSRGMSGVLSVEEGQYGVAHRGGLLELRQVAGAVHGRDPRVAQQGSERLGIGGIDQLVLRAPDQQRG